MYLSSIARAVSYLGIFWAGDTMRVPLITACMPTSLRRLTWFYALEVDTDPLRHSLQTLLFYVNPPGDNDFSPWESGNFTLDVAELVWEKTNPKTSYCNLLHAYIIGLSILRNTLSVWWRLMHYLWLVVYKWIGDQGKFQLILDNCSLQL